MEAEWGIIMKLKSLIEIIEKEYPPELAYDWDNPGLFYGDINSEISKIIVTLDITCEVVRQAIQNGTQLILSHHPVTMGGIKKLSDKSIQSETITEAIKNNIAIYSAHTNMDTARNGINTRLAEMFELESIFVMEADKSYPDCGLGRVGKLKKPVSLNEFCETVKQKLNTPFVRVCGSDRIISFAAFASGSCSEYVPSAIKSGADVIVTADMKYHNCIEYVHDGIAIIDAGHYPTENIVKDMFTELLRDTGAEIIPADTSDIFRVI